MTKKQQTTDPYEMEMLDLMNEVGGKMIVKYHTATLTADKDFLLTMRNNGFPTDVMSCIMFGLAAELRNEQKVMAFLQEAAEAGATPSVTFEAPDGEALNITGKEKDNPMLNTLVQVVQNR